MLRLSGLCGAHIFSDRGPRGAVPGPELAAPQVGIIRRLEWGLTAFQRFGIIAMGLEATLDDNVGERMLRTSIVISEATWTRLRALAERRAIAAGGGRASVSRLITDLANAEAERQELPRG